MRVVIASSNVVPPEFADDGLLMAALTGLGVDVERAPWDDRETDWAAYDAVVIRSTWDYAHRRPEFVEWADAVGGRLHNTAALIRWNSDKRYLGDLAEAGFPAVETLYVGPTDAPPPLEGELVVKPTVSAGGRDTGRFSPAAHGQARDLIAAIQAGGRTAMVQPFEPTVDTAGETAVVCLDGRPSHVLHKRAVLRPDEVAPLRDDPLGAAEVMYHPELVTGGEASERELDLTRRILDHVTERFAYVPLYARVDMLTRENGEPLLLELEAVEPNLYLDRSPGAAERVARAIAARAG